MAEAAEENQDQSMEEILQSIKRIIADEDEEGGESAEAVEAADEAVAEAPAADAGSDVLELTELVQEDGTVTNLDEGADAPVADSAPLEAAPEPAPAPAPEPAKAEAAPAGDDTLVSDAAASASASALNSLKSTEKPKPKPMPKVDSPSFRSGATVEDLVMESLKPMLSEWLDANLPGIVEHLVEKEIKRISDK